MARAPRWTTVTVLALAAGAAFLTAACGTGSSRYDFSEELDDNGPPEQVPVEPEAPTVVAPAPEPEPVTAWACHYDPTYDDDWHNDVLCTDGIDVDRPYLREGDDFITEDEIMESAREYENSLNAG